MKNRNFILLWIGKFISQMGDKFYAIALAWWILQKTNSPISMGFFLFVSTLPELFLGFAAGAYVDQQNRKRILVITDVLRGALVCVIAGIAFYGELQVYQIYLAGILLSIITAFFEPAAQAIIMEVVHVGERKQANSLNQMVSGFCTVAGPLVGAYAVSVMGLPWVFAMNGISYFVSGGLASVIQSNRKREKRAVEKLLQKERIRGVAGNKENLEIQEVHSNLWDGVKEGIYFIKDKPSIRRVLGMIALVHLFVGGLSVILPFLAKGLPGKGVQNLGYLEMAIGMGILIGSGWLHGSKKLGVNEKRLLAYIFTVGAGFLVLGVELFYGARILLLYLPVICAMGISIAGASISWMTLLQKDTPDEMAGRVFSLSAMISNTTLPLSYGLFGILLVLFSMKIVLLWSGIILLSVCLISVLFL